MKYIFVTALIGLSLAGVAACGDESPSASATPTSGEGSPSAAAKAGDPAAACAAVTDAREAALEALLGASLVLGGDNPSAATLKQVGDDLKAAFTTMKSSLAAASAQAGDTDLKAKISAYETSVAEVIVAVEAAKGDKAKLEAAAELPAMESAEKAVMDACP